MIVTLLVHLRQFLLYARNLILILLVALFAASNDLVGDQAVRFNTTVCIFLGLIFLGEECFPAAHIIHCLVFMGQKVSFYKRRVLHRDLLPFATTSSFQIDIG